MFRRESWVVQQRRLETGLVVWKKVKRNVGKPLAWETISFQEMYLNSYLDRGPKLSVLVADLRITPFSSLVNRICHTLFGNLAFQMFWWLKSGMQGFLDG